LPRRRRRRRKRNRKRRVRHSECEKLVCAEFMPGIVAVLYWLHTAHRCQCTDWYEDKAEKKEEKKEDQKPEENPHF